MRTQYNTRASTVFIIEHDSYTWRRISGPDEPIEKVEEGKYKRFFINPQDQCLHIECEPQPDSDITRIIHSTPVIAIRSWVAHYHIYDVYGFYEDFDSTRDGYFCLCGKFSDDDSTKMILGGWRPNMKKDDLMPPVPKIIQLPNVMQFDPAKPLILPPITQTRRVPVIPKDAPYATSIHDKE